MNRKKIFMILGSTVILFVIIPMIVLAYLRSIPNEKKNEIDVKSVRETIEETFPTVESQKAGENTFQKEVAVKNNGTAPCYVRVYMNFSDSTIRDSSKLSIDGTNFKKWDDYLNKEATLPGTLLSDTADGEWIYLDSGNEKLDKYFYYTKYLKPEESTDLLLKKIKTTYENLQQITDFQVIVYSETVQAVDNEGNFLSCQTAWENFLR